MQGREQFGEEENIGTVPTPVLSSCIWRLPRSRHMDENVGGLHLRTGATSSGLSSGSHPSLAGVPRRGMPHLLRLLFLLARACGNLALLFIRIYFTVLSLFAGVANYRRPLWARDTSVSHARSRHAVVPHCHKSSVLV